MVYGRSWNNVSVEQFIDTLDCYPRWYNEKRIKMSLGAISPVDYRRSIGGKHKKSPKNDRIPAQGRPFF
jgi:hypothetical protein